MADSLAYQLTSSIRNIPDFPQPGVLFKDITTVLKDIDLLKQVIDDFAARYQHDCPDVIAGIESRGFILGVPLALALGVPFVPIRKPGKLPARTVSQTYQLEYGTNTIEIHADAVEPGQRVLIVDDLLATGGTAQAACCMVEKIGGLVQELAFMIELTFLDGRSKLGDQKVYSQVSFGAGE